MGLRNMNFPEKFYRWKDTSEFSVHYGKWDEWQELNVPGGTTEEDILYWISKGKPYQICEVLSTRIIGYES